VAEELELPIRLVLVDPPSGIDFGIQRGRGAAFESVFVQRSTAGDLCFDFSMAVADTRADGLPNFLGPFAQGPPASRFFYVGVGVYAGQKGTPWARRIKVPLQGIDWALIRKALSKPEFRVTASIPGTGRDAGPSCATVRPIDGWQVIRDTGSRPSPASSVRRISHPELPCPK
jgi:hypothetical protein